MARARMPHVERRKALRALKQRGIVVHVGALEQIYSVFLECAQEEFPSFLNKVFEFLSRPDGAVDGILTEKLAITIAEKLQREIQRFDQKNDAVIDVIDAFSVPLWRPTSRALSNTGSAGSTVKAPDSPNVDASAKTKAEMFRLRYELILSKTMRNPQFRPPTTGILTSSKKSPYFQLTGVESLQGTKGERLVLGMLTQLEEGKWFLEDLHGTVRVDLSNVTCTAGLHTESSFVIAQGILVDSNNSEAVFQVSAMGTPPLELRENSIESLGKDANLFGGQFDFSQQTQLLELEKGAEDKAFLFLSDVALDNSIVLAGLRHLFNGYIQDEVVPSVIVLMGNFLSHPFGQNLEDIHLLNEKFTELGEMIRDEFKPLAEETVFVIIPGTQDPGPGNVLPRPPMPKMVTRGFVNAIGEERVKLATNPCRLRYLTQEIVFLRDDIMQKMVRHCVVKPDFQESKLLSEHLIKSVVDQANLCPLPPSARPIFWSHSHALWLFPTPHTIVLADKVDGFICKYGGSLGLNPGSFATDLSFQMYLPAERRAQQCSLDSEDVGEKKVDVEEQSSVIESPDEEADYASNDVMDDDDDLDLEVELDRPRAPVHRDTSRAIDTQESEDEEEDKDEVLDTRSPNGSEEEEESDDDSMLAPPEGIERIDIKSHVRNSAYEESFPS